jgi:hypothetical protein
MPEDMDLNDFPSYPDDFNNSVANFQLPNPNECLKKLCKVSSCSDGKFHAVSQTYCCKNYLL